MIDCSIIFHCEHAVVEGNGLTYWVECKLKDRPVDPAECKDCCEHKDGDG